MKEKRNLILGGLAVGAISVWLVVMGNPGNMGYCIACFLRDIAGGVGLQRAEIVQYVRPEIIGLVVGAFVIAKFKGEFKPKGGSAPAIRFIIGFFVMIGALVFLGCPMRMVIRLGGGDLNAIFGILGFIAGIGIGVFFLNKGFSLNRTYKQPITDGMASVGISIMLLVLLLAVPSLLFFSESGPGSMTAPVWASLVAGLAVGAIAQRTRLCMVGGIRDIFLFKDFTLICGFVAIFVAILIGNLALGSFNLGFLDQPIAHTDGLWNFIGMALVGVGSVLLGGCPLRQLILSGEGNSDSTVAILGMVVGAAFCHNFSLASSTSGPTTNGKVAVIIGLIILAIIGVMNSQIGKDLLEKKDK